ncbi:MAG: hypothetical protein ACI4QJ_01750 [Candidatus Spyradenecus sp.]
MGQLCPKYLYATMSKALQDYVGTYGEVPKPIATERLRMSASTMERILLLYRFNHPRGANKRSGSKAALAAQIPAGPGSFEETDGPDILQVDTIPSAAATFASTITPNSSQPPSRVILLTFYISKALIMLGSTF